MISPYRIAVFASGSGGNFQAIIDEVQVGKLDVSIELLVCDRPEVKVIERATKAGVPAFIIHPKEYDSPTAYEEIILQELQRRNIDLVVLAGYMRIVGDTLLQSYAGRMVNIHPSLLPAFPGMNGVRQAIDYGVKVTGVTVHYVDGGMDTGPIIVQRVVEVHDHDTESSLAVRIHEVEHELYPQVIRWLSQGQVTLNGRKVSKEGL